VMNATPAVRSVTGVNLCVNTVGVAVSGGFNVA